MIAENPGTIIRPEVAAAACESEPSGVPFDDEEWEELWREFTRMRPVKKLERWLWFGWNGEDDDEGLLHIANGETLVFGRRRRDRKWYFVGVDVH